MAETQKAMFGAGCFWGVEAAFRRQDGVVEVTSGYAGGTIEAPTYAQVCSDSTGHAEVVLVTFDPTRISYDSLLETFFALHDPTQVNRQGPDIGSQYRSVIFTFNANQHAAATACIAALNASGRFPRPIASTVETAGHFWPAEDYHQRYLEKNAGPFCR
ncbi:MAG: peptide-methionine (S)-S-oxide reductase MsrA [Rhodospirillaceae bacterium]|nr:peptide-methionine (S)-S-oxide reductase MsrA [Rhodospirillaceae bacterium]